MRIILHLLPALALFPCLADEPAGKPDEAIQAIQKLLDEELIESRHFQEEMPLSRFLTALEKQLPKERKLSLRIDETAFGNKAAEVAATPVRLPRSPAKRSLRSALEAAIAKVKVRADYRITAGEVALTTPQRALYTVSYDIRPLVERPTLVAAFNSTADLRSPDPARRVAAIVHTLLSATEDGTKKGETDDPDAVQVQNGNRLVVRANAARHAQIAETLQYWSRVSDMHVVVQAHLYEVDAAFYTRLSKQAKRLTLDDMDELERNPPVSPLWKLLEKQELVLAGEEVKIDSGREAVLLSRQRAIRFLGPDQVRRGEKERQTILEGTSILGAVEITGDRRFVRIKITEKSAELQVLEKVKVWVAGKEGGPERVEAELPIMDETVLSRPLLIPDGGTVLVPLQYRPRALREKDHWWVLKIAPRIIIEDEEQILRRSGVESVLPAVLADVLSNPRLKTMRDAFGTPGEKRFALVDSDAWAWKEFRPAVPGFQLTPSRKTGNRLLGVRIDQDRLGEKDTIRLTLINAGGNENGEAVGGATFRYSTRRDDKGKVVIELAPSP